MKKYQVFISSTYNDLIQERASVIETVLALSHIPLGMEAFTATSRKSMELIEKAIDLSDYYVLIIGDNYGSIYKKGISFTEVEYNYALSKRKPILAFIKEGKLSSSEDLEKQKKLKKFKNKVQTSGINVMFWSNKDKLARYVSTSLSNEFNANEQIGWIRADSVEKFNNIWGLKEIFETRQKMNVQLNEVWGDLQNNLDIIGFGLKSFRDAQTNSIIEKVKKGLKIRILTINPLSPFVKQREKDEQVLNESIKKTIIDLEKWVLKLKEISRDENNVELKFYNSLPLDFYWKQDDRLCVGPYLYGIGSQQTVTLEFDKGTTGYNFYSNYFENLWNNDDFCKNDYDQFKSKK
jgi:hypothetical protein